MKLTKLAALAALTITAGTASAAPDLAALNVASEANFLEQCLLVTGSASEKPAAQGVKPVAMFNGLDDASAKEAPRFGGFDLNKQSTK